MSELSSEANYITRLSDWVSKQGVLFQLVHGSAVGGIGRPMIAIFLRFIIIAVVVVLVGWFYFYNAVEKGGFADNLKAVVESKFGGDEVTLSKVSRGNQGVFAGVLEIGEISMNAGSDTTFESRADQSLSGRNQTDLEMNSIVLSPIGVMDGSVTPWKIEEISVDSVSAKLRLGGESEEEAMKSHGWLFNVVENSPLRRLYVANTNLSWGYTHLNLGSIKEVSLTGLLNSGGWDFTLADGTLNYMWLRSARIIKANIKVERDQIVISDATLTMGQGAVKLDAIISVGARPQIEGSITFKRIPVNLALRDKYQDFIDGTVSGTGEFSGSLVDSKGLNYNLDIELGETDSFDITDKIPAITALSVIDASSNYENLSFSEGSFEVSHLDGVTSIEEIRMLANNGIVAVGSFQLRAPREAELLRDLQGKNSSEYEDELENVLKKGFQSEKDKEDESVVFGTAMVDNSEAAKIRKTNRFGNINGAEPSHSKYLELGRRSSEEARDYFGTIRRFDGELKLGMSAASFLRSERLQAAYPFDNQSRKHWVVIPLSGSVQEVTGGTAEALYELGRRIRRSER